MAINGESEVSGQAGSQSLNAPTRSTAQQALVGSGTEVSTVLYSLQLAEAREFQPSVQELAEYSDHYFSTDNLEALTRASGVLVEALDDDQVSESEAELIALAEEATATNGYNLADRLSEAPAGRCRVSGRTLRRSTRDA